MCVSRERLFYLFYFCGCEYVEQRLYYNVIVVVPFLLNWQDLFRYFWQTRTLHSIAEPSLDLFKHDITIKRLAHIVKFGTIVFGLSFILLIFLHLLLICAFAHKQNKTKNLKFISMKKREKTRATLKPKQKHGLLKKKRTTIDSKHDLSIVI